jgi:hypothetical protein
MFTAYYHQTSQQKVMLWVEKWVLRGREMLEQGMQVF